MKRDKGSMFYGASPKIFARASTLRQNMTKAEKMLWERLRKNQMMGLRFKAQHPIDTFIADFYCHKLKLVIEVDGEIHERKEQRDYDLGREGALRELGLTVIRFTNGEIYEDLDGVMEEIRRQCVLLGGSEEGPPASEDMPPTPEGE